MILNILKKLYPFEYSICGKGNDEAIKVFKKYLNFKIHNFESGKSLNGWTIPHSWSLKKGIILNQNKEIIFDAKKKILEFQFFLKLLKVKFYLKI